ncbi:MAG: putative methyltransferase [Acidimicrobiales bacterium]|nr:putative methyltransferase [Acidimicrobiales bacterium]
MPHWFEALADHTGAAYLRYSFTRGTDQEIDFLLATLGLGPSARVLDVGCGPGRHAIALAERGVGIVGVDISLRFVELAAASAPGAAFVRGDALALPVRPGTFDAALSLCQGGFGLLGAGDGEVLRQMAASVRPGGVVCVSAFSAYFAVRYLETGDDFDAATGVNHETTSVRNEAGVEKSFDLWTSCFTPRELRLLFERAGLVVEHLWSVRPGAYRADPPDLEHPEFLVVARRPG